MNNSHFPVDPQTWGTLSDGKPLKDIPEFVRLMQIVLEEARAAAPGLSTFEYVLILGRSLPPTGVIGDIVLGIEILGTPDPEAAPQYQDFSRIGGTAMTKFVIDYDRLSHAVAVWMSSWEIAGIYKTIFVYDTTRLAEFSNMTSLTPQVTEPRRRRPRRRRQQP